MSSGIAEIVGIHIFYEIIIKKHANTHETTKKQ
jgi:hypothetical protein